MKAHSFKVDDEVECMGQKSQVIGLEKNYINVVFLDGDAAGEMYFAQPEELTPWSEVI